MRLGVAICKIRPAVWSWINVLPQMKNKIRFCFWQYEWSESCSVMFDSLWSHGLYIHGIFQSRILEWVAIPVSKGSSQCRDWTQVSHIAGGFTSWATRESLAVKSIHKVYVLVFVYVYTWSFIYFLQCAEAQASPQWSASQAWEDERDQPHPGRISLDGESFRVNQELWAQRPGLDH